MGKTKDSITQFVLSITGEEMTPLFEALGKTDQLQLRSIFKHLVKFKVAIGHAKLLRPIEVACILMLLVVYKVFKKLFHSQHEELRRLRRAMESAGLIVEPEPSSTGEDEAEEAYLTELAETYLKDMRAQLPQ